MEILCEHIRRSTVVNVDGDGDTFGAGLELGEREAFLCATMNGDSEIAIASEMRSSDDIVKIISLLGIAMDDSRLSREKVTDVAN